MSDKPLVSVIVPMYNVEAYLPQCVDSLLNQTLRDIEIILVDDGSPDRCADIAAEYVEKDPRVRLVRRPNGGLGPARNTGMDAARGAYLGFIDSDDWAEPDMFESLYDEAVRTGAEVVFTGVKTVSDGEVTERREHPFAGQVLEGQDRIFALRRSFLGAAPARVKDDPVPISVWIGLYEAEWAKKSTLRFINIRSEDIFFNTNACRRANKVAAIPGVPYCYRNDGQSSITRSFNVKTIESFTRLFRALRLLGDEEPAAFRGEAHTRIDRAVIDGSRTLVKLICASEKGAGEKAALVRGIFKHPAVREASDGYPFHMLPFKQAVFCLCVKLRFPGAALLLAGLRKA